MLAVGEHRQVKIFDGRKAAEARAAKDCARCIMRDPDGAFGVSTGNTMVGVAKCLVRELQRANADLRELRLVGMDVYLDEDFNLLPVTHPMSFRGWYKKHILDPLAAGLQPERCINPNNLILPIPTFKTPADRRVGTLVPDFTSKVQELFGAHRRLPWLIGLGVDGHVGFVMPEDADPKKPARIVRVNEGTTAENLRKYAHGDQNAVVNLASTVGIEELRRFTDRLIMAAFGREKADAVAATLESKSKKANPARIAFENHERGHWTIYLDQAAASKLKHRDRYEFVH